METNTKIGIAGGSLLTIFSNITQNDIEKTIVLGAIGTVVSIVVSLLIKVSINYFKRLKG